MSRSLTLGLRTAVRFWDPTLAAESSRDWPPSLEVLRGLVGGEMLRSGDWPIWGLFEGTQFPQLFSMHPRAATLFMLAFPRPLSPSDVVLAARLAPPPPFCCCTSANSACTCTWRSNGAS